MMFAAGFITATSLVAVMYIGFLGGVYLTPNGLLSFSAVSWLVLGVAWLVRKQTDRRRSADRWMKRHAENTDSTER